MIHLVLGGARSGKSRYGETLAATYAEQVSEQVSEQCSAQSPSCIYIATATALDEEMSQRIARHQQDRVDAKVNWLLIESPLALASTLMEQSAADKVILVDCLTLYLTNHLVASEETHRNGVDDLWQQQKIALLNALPQLKGHIIFISNEVGSGIVPLGELTRRFADEAGWLNQAIAEQADKVTLIVAGLPLALK
ncbi:bifunctional adenosylcobinamide kinase/adenosylcobinamide-phosphate guanylyltransferase [Shewanella sp. 1_MG-2023]|uniref:bifunctional adenosylcobinamide kinase/adenosylcobinamide-phosphate guanylyltransferase n=1 Tax=unclassified Shewanella TaxID=196818 RepID=UPI0026E2DDEB|nr:MULTISPECIES: bifunctional adenosylcobinamide kinase/adenosylcobinamide-phosphate guanylyltransferase [unclassified Shewanella]MDO6610424.1 bifunctional adenosylcobinamide kinase/adenosylcobinamide-phosphate guanylyltransferase [Shewanella sp. 7_MG-2023]MDO6770549.1 bifunctional adenosylcobinamide kinase/adenosylcobinamide-phosphate guanylyltransferase [Shewanella sp. 2_MG-2023]MDO6794436.1 bifunctional adenosylcobinamide kinase/adenosylcobinamide-phosphate guanylyltransferase [Shewanella sp.